MSDISYRVRTSAIISEIIDGEAIIMDMTSGNYFSTTGVGAILWRLVTTDVSRADILDAVVAAYPMTQSVRHDVAMFLEDVVTAGLVVQQPATGVRRPVSSVFASGYERPLLQSHADMKDLIELDPIHDVGDTGWPIRKDAA